MENSKKIELIKNLMKRNILLTPELVKKADDEKINKINIILNKEDFKEEEIIKILNEDVTNSVKIIFSYDEITKKIEAQDFITYFNNRYNSIKTVLTNRQELQDAISIKRILSSEKNKEVSIIGMVYDKRETNNKNIIISLEDQTGTINVIVNKNKQEIYNLAKDITLDETIGVIGNLGEGVIFANNIIIPDVPNNKELKKSPYEGYAVFIGDLHFGSKAFMKENFERFISWLKGDVGNEEQRDIAKKIKYIFFIGDLVDGVGIYPNQLKDLEVQDIKEQYNLLADALKKIPSNIKIIIAPGNHDAMRIAEPQPKLYKDFAESIYLMPNVFCVSNPAMVNIDSNENFSGFNVLIYHGFSFNYYAFNIESIKQGGAQTRADLIMKFLLQRRHLAPTHDSTLYIPNLQKDPLFIETIPDFFVSGHIHRATVSNYKNITLLNCSCWMKKTDYQEKIGLEPQPGRAILVNLQTREVKIIRF